MVNPASRSTVVVTSRLWPNLFDPLEPDDESLKRYRLPLFRTNDLIGVEPFCWWKDNEREVSALCSLLDGHVYALVLAAEMLSKAGKSGAQAELKSLRQTLTGTPPDIRLSRMIQESIKAADKEWDGMATKLLERLAVFFSTVSRPTIEICYQAAIVGRPPDDIGSADALVEDLASRRLIFKLTTKRGKSAPPAYTVHPLVRGYVYQSMHKADTNALPSFALPGFTAATSALDPGDPEAVKMLTDLFDRLHDGAERMRQEGRGSDARRLCRSAFSVVRSRMELLTAPRWCSYDVYFRFIIRLTHLAKNVSPTLWDYAERHDIRAVEDIEGPLYADDLAWLYNELGLACYGEGAMLDALAVWEQGLEINRVIDSYEEGGSYLFQSQCNLGAAYIHRGNLDIAERYLADAERTNYRLNDSDHAGRIKGYLALVQHLRGNLPMADELYQEALDRLKEAGANPRAESIFLRHRCDLKIKLQDFDKAKHFIESSRALAEAGDYPELVASARMSHGHWFRKQGHFAEALREYNAALGEARRIGIRRLECEVISELARLALDLGEAELARQRATDSLHIANELALGLKQTHDLVVLGRATIEAGQRRLGIAYLKHAKRLAHRQGYWLRGYEAEEQLHRFGETGDIAPAG
jgi:tetratricopeptide (TPR) repeat protein